MLLVAFGMLGLGYASVPLYRIFCQATGYEGTPRKAEGAQAPGAVVGKVVTVRFDANVSAKLPWSFAPQQVSQRAAIGARELAYFTATINSDKPLTGRAVFNVSPDQVATYFTKIQCFCFTEQTLQPHQTVQMPVIYYVDPAFLKDADAAAVNEITLSYTFYPAEAEKG